MNNSLSPGEEKNSPRVLNQIVFSLFIRKKKKVYKVLSAFCILCHWSPDNWLYLGGSLLDMLRLSSGKRYSSKLSLPSQGTVRHSLTSKDTVKLKLHYREKVSFRSIIPIGHTAHPYFLLYMAEWWSEFHVIYDYRLHFIGSIVAALVKLLFTVQIKACIFAAPVQCFPTFTLLLNPSIQCTFTARSN